MHTHKHAFAIAGNRLGQSGLRHAAVGGVEDIHGAHFQVMFRVSGCGRFQPVRKGAYGAPVVLTSQPGETKNKGMGHCERVLGLPVPCRCLA